MALTDAEIADIDRRIQRAGASNCWTGTNGSLAADARRLVRHIQEIAAVCEYPQPHRICVKCLTCLGSPGAVESCPSCKGKGHVFKVNSPAEPHKYRSEDFDLSLGGMSREEYEKRVNETWEKARKDTEYPIDHILRGERELKRYLGDEAEEAAILTEDDVAELADETRKAADIGGSVVPQPETAGPTAAVRLLDTARAAVIDRHATYGPPREHFARTVGMVNALFADVLRRPLTVADWARIMLLDKLARDLGPKPHADNAVDLAGYAACLAECQSAPPAAR